MIVSIYWILLADFGQIAPTIYPYLQSPIWQGYPSYLTPTQYPPTNNIFYNETLFKNYSSYLNETILPLFNSYYQLNTSLPEFNLDVNNRIQPIPMTFVRSYSCTQRQLKGWVSVVISIAVADYSLIFGAYGVAVLIGKWLQMRNSGENQVEMTGLLGGVGNDNPTTENMV